jgi:hypothetical protein
MHGIVVALHASCPDAAAVDSIAHLFQVGHSAVSRYTIGFDRGNTPRRSLYG